MEISKNIAINTIASYIGRAVGTIFALTSIGLITRALGKEGFGEYSTIVAFLTTAQILADLGLHQLLTREISQHPEREKELFSQFFTLRLVFAVLFLSVAAGIVFLFPYSTDVKAGVAVSAIAFVFLSLSQLFSSIFQKYIQVYKAAFAELIGRAAQLGVVAFFFITSPGLLGFLAALILGSFSIFAVNAFFAYRLVPFRLSISFTRWRYILKETLPIAASIAFTMLYFRADTILLSILGTQEEVGVYNVAYKVLEALIFFPAVFVGLMMPAMSRYAKDSRKKLGELLGRLTDVATIFALPMVVGGILLSASFVNIIGGPEFLVSAQTLQILFIAVGVIFYGTLFGSAVIALNLQKYAMWAYLVGFVVNFVANIIVIPKYSYIGAAWTTVGTEVLVTLFLAALVWRTIRYHPSFPKTSMAVLGTAVVTAFIFLLAPDINQPLPPYLFISAAVAGGAIYFSSLWLTQKLFSYGRISTQ